MATEYDSSTGVAPDAAPPENAVSGLGRLAQIRGIRGILYRAGELKRRTSFALNGVQSYTRVRRRPRSEYPGIAAVMVGRNDDYMSDFRERLIAMIEWNMRYLISEVVFVEWNPPADRELLSPGLAARFENLKAYVVPAEVHEATCQNSHIKLLEYHAKNVGIRRAEAPWVLSTNADAAVAFNSIEAILSTGLSEDTIWTAQRIDVDWREGEQQRLGLLGTLRYKRVNPYNRYGTGEFALASKERWARARGFDEKLTRHRIGCDVRGVAQMEAQGARIKRAGSVLHLIHPTSCGEGVQPHHGEWATMEGVPYQNDEDWGLGTLKEREISDRVYVLEP